MELSNALLTIDTLLLFLVFIVLLLGFNIFFSIRSIVKKSTGLLKAINFVIQGYLVGWREKIKFILQRFVMQKILFFPIYLIVILILMIKLPRLNIIDNDFIISLLIAYVPEINDKVLYELVKCFAGISITGVPLSLTFFYFYYREQKATAESLAIRSRSWLIAIIAVCMFSSSAFLNGYSSLILIQSTSSEMTLGQSPAQFSLTADNLTLILFCFILFFIALYFGFYLASYSINSINISWLLKRTIFDANRQLWKLMVIPETSLFSKSRKDIYDKLKLMVESIYQMLILAAEKNLDVVYQKQLNNWSKLLVRMNRVTFIPQYLKLTVRYVHLAIKDPEEYRSFFSSVLSNHLLLIFSLYKKHKLQEAVSCVNLFFILHPNKLIHKESNVNNEKLIVDYYTRAYELISFLQTTDTMEFRSAVDKIEEWAANKNALPHIICLFRALITKTINSGDVRVLTELVNSMRKINNMGDFCSSTSVGDDMTIANSQMNGVISYVLLQALIKSVELGYYECTGFLVKYIVSNFPSDLTNKVYSKVKESKGYQDKYLDNHELAKCMDISFKINADTAMYCLRKITVLIFLQQKYIMTYPVNGIQHHPESIIDTAILGRDDIGYMFKKIISAGNQYGLLSVKDEKFVLEQQSILFRERESEVVFAPI